MQKIVGFVAVVLLILLVIGGTGIVKAQLPEAEFIEETGHWIKNEFLEFYRTAPEPERLFGYPITDEFTDPNTSTEILKTQYFQKARFDYISQSGTPMVKLFPLGETFYTEGKNSLVPLTINSTSCQYFDQSGHTVCYAFLDFYKAHQGGTYLGLPISELEYEDGRYVQYFKNFRLEWWPERPAGQRVVVADLGRIYFDMRVGNPEILQPERGQIPLRKPLSLQMNVFAEHALLPQNSQQAIYLIVRDQYLNAIEDANISIKVFLQEDSPGISYRASSTNMDGISQFALPIGNLPVGQMVRVLAEAEYQGLTTTAETWFRVWW